MSWEYVMVFNVIKRFDYVGSDCGVFLDFCFFI